MNMQVKEKPNGLAGLPERIRQVLYDSSAGACGLIMAQVYRLKEAELKALETWIRMEDRQLEARFGYEPHAGLLTVMLPGQSLASSHFLSLSVKEFLLNSDLPTGRLVVTSFPECAEPEERVMRDLLNKLSEQPDGGDPDILLYTDPGQGTESSSIVVIDQNEDLTEFLQVRLRLKGYDVHVAGDGVEGLELVEQVCPDLVLTELNLPAMDGYQVIHRIRQASRGPDASKIMVLTDKGLDHEVQKCFELGVADYVKKPFSPIELEARIRRLLG